MQTSWLRAGGMMLVLLYGIIAGMAAPETDARLSVAVLAASWFPNSHPDAIAGRILRTYSMDGTGIASELRIASLYNDRPQQGDISQQLAADYHIRLCPTIEDALTLGTGKLAVGGVILCTEWADYPRSPLGQIMYPHRQMFDAIVKVYQASGKVAPIFIDKHLADTWEDSKYIYDTAKRMGIPLMAGSSVPVGWRVPPIEINANVPLKEMVGISMPPLDGYGFHGLEAMQTLAERRKGGETGVTSVQCLEGPAVWEAAGTLYDPELLADALAVNHPALTLDQVKQRVKDPVLFIIHYSDGLRAEMFTLPGAANHWTAAWRYRNGVKAATMFGLDNAPRQLTMPDGRDQPPRLRLLHHGLQMRGVEDMFLTGKPAWPVERSLLTSGILDRALVSKAEHGRVVETPEMSAIHYDAYWRWAPLPVPRDANL